MSRFEKLKSPAYQLWLASNAWQRQMRRALQPWNLTHVQFMILASVQLLGEESEGCVTQRNVARFAGIDENMTSQVIRTLEDDGLLERQKHPTDGRAFRLVLTEKGAALTADARVEVRKVSQAFFAPIGDRGEELADLLRILVPEEE